MIIYSYRLSKEKSNFIINYKVHKPYIRKGYLQFKKHSTCFFKNSTYPKGDFMMTFRLKIVKKLVTVTSK